MFHLKKRFNQSTFINEVENNIEQLKAYPSWNYSEKNILNKVVSKFTIINCNSDKSNNVGSKI